MTDSGVPRLVVQTRETDPSDDLIEFTDPHEPLAWLRRGDGMVGVGSPVVRLEIGGSRSPASPAPRTPQLAREWRAVVEAAEIDDEVGIPGTGLIAFGALAFDERSDAASTLVVPAMIVGRRHGRAWITHIRHADTEEGPTTVPEPRPYGTYWAATLGPGHLDPPGYQDAVRRGLAAIDAGELDKVVIARDLVGTAPAGADLRRLARSLASGYPDCWTYAVDGIIGASPETLVTVSEGAVTARVLAGTAARGADPDADTAASTELATSAKDLDEHQYAVQSVLSALRPHTSALAAAEQPFTLKLPNVWHLATDVEGALWNGSSGLDLVAELHPTAAVAGTPTAVAVEAIRRIEQFDRRRYAGPVGWIDAAGDGEWAIALRCAQFGSPVAPGYAASPDTTPVTAHAGAGIVAGSVPESELLETRVKFRPIVDALA